MTEQNSTKEQVQADLVAHLNESVTQDDAEVAMRREDAAPIREDEHRADDISHQDEAGDVHALFQEVDDRQRALVKAAEALDVSPKSTVEPGAIIEMDGEHFIVGVASDEFTSGGTAYSGLSTEAPIYDAIQGKKAGESAEFASRTVTVTSVA